MNFILIFSDGWRADFANNPALTPNLHKFLNEYGGYKFMNAYSVTTWTWPVTMSIFTGLLPIQHGCDDIGYQKHDAEHNLAPDIFAARNCTKDDFLTTKLKERGYTTKIFDNWDGLKYLKGAEQAVFDKEIPQTWNRYALLDMTEEEIKEPFFYFARVIDAGHAPWGRFSRKSKNRFDAAVATGKFPFEHDARISPAKWNKRVLRRLLSKQCEQWDEQQMAKLLEWFVKVGLYQNTVLIIMSDHGVSLGEHGPVGHGMGCHEEIIHVPLYVYWPGKSSGLEEVNDLVSLVDLMPTILEEESIGYGVNLFKRKDDRSVFFEYKRQRKIEGVEQEFQAGVRPERNVFTRGVRWQDFKLVYSRPHTGGEIFELHNFGKQKTPLTSFEEGVKRLLSVYPNFD